MMRSALEHGVFKALPDCCSEHPSLVPTNYAFMMDGVWLNLDVLALPSFFMLFIAFSTLEHCFSRTGLIVPMNTQTWLISLLQKMHAYMLAYAYTNTSFQQF
jgi:hypothetical protein